MSSRTEPSMGCLAMKEAMTPCEIPVASMHPTFTAAAIETAATENFNLAPQRRRSRATRRVPATATAMLSVPTRTVVLLRALIPMNAMVLGLEPGGAWARSGGLEGRRRGEKGSILVVEMLVDGAVEFLESCGRL